MAQNGVPLSTFFDVERLPCCAEVVSEYSGSATGDALRKGTVLTLLYLLREPAAQFSDGLGHRYTEAVTFDKCLFNLLPEDASFDNKMYLRVEDVMRLQKRPPYVRALQGYAYDSSVDGQVGELCQGQILQVSNCVICIGGQQTAVWYIVPEDGSDVVPLHLPFSVEGHFTTNLDDGKYKLSELIGNSLQKKFYWNLPVRVSVSCPAKHSSVEESKYTLEALSEQQWLIISDGERLFRALADLKLNLKPIAMSEGDLCTPMQLLAGRVNHNDVEKIGPPPAASLGTVVGVSPALPPRPPRKGITSTNTGSDLTVDDIYSSIYSYVELSKFRGRHQAVTGNPASGPDPFLAGVPPPPGAGEPFDLVSDEEHARHYSMPQMERSLNAGEHLGGSNRRPSLPILSSPKPRRKVQELPKPPSSPTLSRPRLKSPESPKTPCLMERLPGQIGRSESSLTKAKRPVPLPHSQGDPSGASATCSESELNEAETARQKLEQLKLRCFKLEKEKAALQREVNRFHASAQASHSHVTCDQLCRLLASRGLGQYAQAFSAEEVDGSLLALLDEDTLAISLGVTNRLHRLKIRQLLEQSA